MPEIKHAFTQGKMNKDLDERLVENGQYRDAMNIQVTTSEGADVGTVQNILGNANLFTNSKLAPNSTCVGAIASEKDNCFYWFVYHSTKNTILRYKNGQVEYIFVDINNVLKFPSSGEIITGINIIDKFLFWTDNYTEPKKINIDLCKEGTDPSGFYHTKLIVPKRNITSSNCIDILEEHITVIKKSPKLRLTLDPVFDEQILAKADFDFDGMTVGDEASITFYDFNTAGATYKIGDIVILKNSENVEVARIRIIPIVGPVQPGSYSFELLSLSSIANVVVTYDSEKEDIGELFKRKFVRFGFRYKFNDGEYSSFSSFTEVVFKPDVFEYNSKEAYNKAMENNLISLKLRNFLNKETPKDVVQVDILYKESNSSPVYIVDKIKYNDPNTVTAGLESKNNWQANMYEITSDLIYAIVPSNQLLRVWDNVPRKALSQEITGNRVVYGNYLQNYDVLTKPILQGSYNSRYKNNTTYVNNYFLNQTTLPIPQLKTVDYLYGQKSLKSLRSYQLGITYLDEFNRETPIFTSSESIFRVPKKHADNKTKIEGRISTLPPDWAKSFKVYVKETATEYYNIAMNRVYRAEDGNLWLSFPSSERNKVDEETFLILKKAIDSDTLVEEEAKYKILAIESEAPEYVATEKVSLAEISCGTTTSLNNAEIVFGIYGPTVNSKSFRITTASWLSGGTESMETITEPLFMALRNNLNNDYTTLYKVKSVSLDGSYYQITLNKVFETQDAELVYPSYPTTTSGGSLDTDPDLRIIFYKQEIIKESPQFKGMFFVKISNDSVAEKNVFVAIGVDEYEVVNTMPTHYFLDEWVDASNSTTDYTRTSTLSNWRDLLGYGGTSNSLFPNNHELSGDIIGGFFIDEAFYIDVQPGGGAGYDNLSSQGHVNQVYRDVVQEWWEDNGMSGSYYDSYSGVPFGVEYVIWNWWLQKRKVFPGQTFFMQNKDQQGSYLSGSTYNITGFPDSRTFTAEPKFGKGIYEENGKHYVEVSFSEIGETSVIVNGMTPADMRDANGNGPGTIMYGSANSTSTFDIRQNKQAQENYAKDYSATNDELKLVASNMIVGKKFKIRSDDNPANIYTINNVETIRRYNFMSWFEAQVKYRTWRATNRWYNQNNSEWDDYEESWNDFMRPENRRFTFKLEIDHSLNDVKINSEAITNSNNIDKDKSVSFQFIENRYDDSTRQVVSENPAIWETEPKESAELDIYYEASEIIPLQVNEQTNERFIPVGSVVTCPNRPGTISGLTYVLAWDDKKVTFNRQINLDAYHPTGQSRGRLIFTNPDDSYRTIFLDVASTQAFYASLNLTSPADAPSTYVVEPNVHSNPFALSWYNCFSFGNGVESNRIRDDFNQPTIDKGVKVSTVLEENYQEERRENGLIYSGIYNSIPGVNNLNQFIQAEKITKDLNPSYGSIQKLHSRSTADGDLIAFCEDRVLKILANKDALFNADGNSNITSTNNVLGQAIPYSGEYGISKNPESFSYDSFRTYFTDKQRGAVLRLSRDGLTPISDYGMSDYFKDALKFSNKIIGSYDDRKGEYNVTLPHLDKTVSFKESIRGWSSFKSFVPQQALSMGNNYYTIKNSLAYKHHVETDQTGNPVDRNTFYGVYNNSSINVLLNDIPSTIKSYKTLNYEGSQSNVNEESTDLRTGYYNLNKKEGWYASSIDTDKQSGSVSEFIEKEGKWFNFIKGKNVNTAVDLKTKEFSFQGIGRVDLVETNNTLYQPITGCTNPRASNYNLDATIDDGSCFLAPPNNITVIGGCMDVNADNYNPLATFDDGSCMDVCDVVLGCTDLNAINFSVNANVDDGSCILPIYGCTDPLALNYNSNANVNDGTCEYSVDDDSDLDDGGGFDDGTGNGGSSITLTVQDTNDQDTNIIPPPNN